MGWIENIYQHEMDRREPLEREEDFEQDDKFCAECSNKLSMTEVDLCHECHEYYLINGQFKK